MVIGGSSADDIWGQGRWTERRGDFHRGVKANWIVLVLELGSPSGIHRPGIGDCYLKSRTKA